MKRLTGHSVSIRQNDMLYAYILVLASVCACKKKCKAIPVGGRGGP
jgi:hypothetical protein